MKHFASLTIIILCLLLSIFLPFPAQAGKEKKTESIAVEDSIPHIKEAAALGSDARFIALLDAQGLKNDIKAPAKLRTFITSLSVVKTGMGAGYLFAIRRAALLWSTGDCVIAGTREQALQRILFLLKELGFSEEVKAREAGAPLLYTFEYEGITQTVTIAKPEDALMAGRAVSTTKILWKAEDTNVSTIMTLDALLSALPYLKEPRIDETLYREIGSRPVEMITLGGTSRNLYDWEVLIVPPEKQKKGSSLIAEMASLLEKLGYTKEGADPSKESFTRKSTGSAAFLDKVAGSDKVHLRIKP
jgi:hypothetical protein